MTYWIRLERAVALLRGRDPIWRAKDRLARIERHPDRMALMEKLMADLKRAFAVLGPPERFEPEVNLTPHVPLDQGLYRALQSSDQPVRMLGERFLLKLGPRPSPRTKDRMVCPAGKQSPLSCAPPAQRSPLGPRSLVLTHSRDDPEGWVQRS